MVLREGLTSESLKWLGMHSKFWECHVFVRVSSPGIGTLVKKKHLKLPKGGGLKPPNPSPCTVPALGAIREECHGFFGYRRVLPGKFTPLKVQVRFRVWVNGGVARNAHRKKKRNRSQTSGDWLHREEGPRDRFLVGDWLPFH